MNRVHRDGVVEQYDKSDEHVKHEGKKKTITAYYAGGRCYFMVSAQEQTNNRD